MEGEETVDSEREKVKERTSEKYGTKVTAR
jgi:hypothetical protein